jgi:hypothetical protein
MARLIDDSTRDDRLISWLRMTFPEAMGESVLKPAVNSREGWWTHGIKPDLLTNSVRNSGQARDSSSRALFETDDHSK